MAMNNMAIQQLKKLFLNAAENISNADIIRGINIIQENVARSLNPLIRVENDPTFLPNISLVAGRVNKINHRLGRKLLGYNVMLKGTNTIDGIKWIDLDAIRDLSEENAFYSFIRIFYFVEKYLLKSFHDAHHNFGFDKINKDILSNFIKSNGNMNFSDFISWINLSNLIEKIEVKSHTSHWSENYSNNMDINNPASIGKKAVNVSKILDKISFDTASDIACNKGYYSFLAAQRCSSVVGIDLIEACIEKAIEYNKQFNLPVCFAVKDIVEMNKNLLYESFRFSSDLVMALAITHHIGSVMSPEQFVEFLDKYSNKYILIEDIVEKESYNNIFKNKGYSLILREESEPFPRTLSLYQKI